MRVRITAHRLERLAARFAPLPSDPQVLWLILVNTDRVGDDREALIDAVHAAVWDELAPLALRGEILASLYVYDRGHARVEAVGYWWNLHIKIESGQPAVAIVERGMLPWRQQLVGTSRGDDLGPHVRSPEAETREGQTGRSSRQRRRSMAWLA
jgi:hypothetical protein